MTVKAAAELQPHQPNQPGLEQPPGTLTLFLSDLFKALNGFQIT